MTRTKFIKVKKEKNYTVIDNTFIRDTRISWKAKGLMTYFLSLPDDWGIHLSEVEKHATDGRDSLRSAIKELKQYGYLKAEQKKEKGKFTEVLYTIIENPNEPQTEIPFTEKPLTENPKLQSTNKQSKDTLNDNDCDKVARISSFSPKPFEIPTPRQVYNFYLEMKLKVKPSDFYNLNQKNGWTDETGRIKNWCGAYTEMNRRQPDEWLKHNPELKFNKVEYRL